MKRYTLFSVLLVAALLWSDAGWAWGCLSTKPDYRLLIFGEGGQRGNAPVIFTGKILKNKDDVNHYIKPLRIFKGEVAEGWFNSFNATMSGPHKFKVGEKLLFYMNFFKIDGKNHYGILGCGITKPAKDVTQAEKTLLDMYIKEREKHGTQ